MKTDGKWGEVGPYLNLLFKIGIMMLMSISVCFGLGLYLYKKTEYLPILFISMVVGIVGGFYLIYRELRKL